MLYTIKNHLEWFLEDHVIMEKFSFTITGIKYIWKYIKQKTVSNISQYFCFTLFLVKNATFVSIRNLYWKKILIVKNFWSVINHVRVYSHHIPFHTALIASEPEIVNKTTRVLKVIHSLVHPLNRTRVGLEADRDHLFGCVSVPLFGPHLSWLLYSHLPKRSQHIWI